MLVTSLCRLFQPLFLRILAPSLSFSHLRHRPIVLGLSLSAAFDQQICIAPVKLHASACVPTHAIEETEAPASRYIWRDNESEPEPSAFPRAVLPVQNKVLSTPNHRVVKFSKSFHKNTRTLEKLLCTVMRIYAQIHRFFKYNKHLCKHLNTWKTCIYYYYYLSLLFKLLLLLLLVDFYNKYIWNVDNEM